MKGRTAGPMAPPARAGVAAPRASDTARETAPAITAFQRQLWSTGLGLFALIAFLVALLAWRAGDHLPAKPLVAALFWPLIFGVLFASLVAVIRILPLVPMFQRSNRACAARHLQLWAPGLATLLDGDERVIGAVYAPCFNPDGRGHGWINALLVWTSQRLLLVPAYPTRLAVPIWSLWLTDIALIRVSRLRRGWLRWIQGPIEQIEIVEETGVCTWIVAGVPGDSRAIVGDLLKTATYSNW